MHKPLVILAVPFALSACGDAPYDPRGVDHDETLLSVSATGEAEARPDEAFFQVGIQNWSGSAKAASEANRADIAKVIDALNRAGVPDKDIQTRAVGIQKIDYGPRKGQFQASNVVMVTVRDVAKAGAAVTAATDAGANVMSGPDLRMSDPEKSANTAYGAAYKAARARAEAYAEAAGMEISRVLSIRDAGGSQGGRYFSGASRSAGYPPPPPPIAMPVSPESMEQGGVIMPGQTTSAVAVQVDFALTPK